MTAIDTRTDPGSRRGSAPLSLAWWVGLLLVVALLWWLAGSGPDRLPEPGPVTAPNRLPLLAPVVVAVLGLWGVARGLPERLPWVALLVGGYVVTGLWTLSLALTRGGMAGLSLAPLTNRASAPPFPDRVLQALAEIGADRPVTLALLSFAGALTTPFVALATRSLCGLCTARRLIPVLSLAPYALIAGGNTEALASAIGAGMLLVSVLASDPGRPGPARLLLAVAAGLLLGVAALFGYSAILLAAGMVCVFFVRRRPLLNVAAGMALLVPLLLAQAGGFDWTEGLGDALRLQSGSRHLPAGFAAALALVLLLGGPCLVASVRKMRMTPGWPFLVAGGAALLAAVVAGLVGDRLAPGSWLPALPWLLVAAVAPRRQAGVPTPTPTVLVAVGAAAAYALAVLAQQSG